MIRSLIVLALSLGLTTPAFAEGIRESAPAAVQRAAAQQAARAPVVSHHVSRSALWAGGALFAAGLALASYSFLHTSDGDFVEPVNASTLANTKAGIGGLGLAAGGGAIMLLGARHGTSPSLNTAAIGISKRISW
ncbi:MAG: hypothetical protein ABMA15_00945 [Vicinamibacterales bacterium]